MSSEASFSPQRGIWRRAANWASDYGMAGVLIGLCVLFSLLTWAEQHPTGAAAADQVAAGIRSNLGDQPGRVIVVVRDSADDVEFAKELTRRLASNNAKSAVTVETVAGGPADARKRFEALSLASESIDLVAVTNVTAGWGPVERRKELFSACRNAEVVSPRSYRWPNFLKRDNLLNIANQISVIAIVAIGMTLVIVAGGIDLSVGSLIALGAVIVMRLIRDYGGAEQASDWGMAAAGLAAIAATGLVGLGSGAIVTLMRIPPFIVTLAVMLAASGFAYMLANGQSIHQAPDRFVWLGRDADLLRIPNSVLLMFALYAVAHFLMTKTVFGRRLYAVGGNPVAAKLSGVPVHVTVMAAFAGCGALAGLGGVLLASQLKSGSPTYGQMYELYVIASVVVGGTSLAGGSGNVLGTLIGAFEIAVIQNGMNLLGIESYTQKVVLGGVILGAVMLDRWRRAAR